MNNHQNYLLGLQATIAQLRAIMTPVATAHHQALVASVTAKSLAVDAARLAISSKVSPTGLGLAFTTASLNLGTTIGQLAKGLEVAKLTFQISPPLSGWILDEIADNMAEERKRFANINPRGKRQKLNRSDFNEQSQSGVKGRKRPGSNNGLDRYMLHDN